jgi:MoaA/NifB/PqqE/SkfB family radical SAM enzyme
MTSYFSLDNDCFLIEGSRDAALYDVTGHCVYLLDEAAHRILRLFEDKSPLDSEWLGPAGQKFLEFLCREGLGFFDDSPAFEDKFVAPARLSTLKGLAAPPSYRLADWSITQSCDVGCSFCPLDTNGLSWQACTTCVRKAAVAENSELDKYTASLVDQIAELGISRLHIRGGNPLLAWDRLNSIIHEAERHPKLIIIVTTPGTGCSTKQLLALCDCQNVRLNLVLFATTTETAKSTGRERVMAHQFTLLRELSQRRVRFSVSILLTSATCSERERMSTSMQENWHLKPWISEIYTADEAMDGISFSHLSPGSRLLTCWRSLEDLYTRALFSTCLRGRLQINPDGSINPCAAVDENCGQIVDGDLGAALKAETLYELWTFSKNDVQPCNCCALRYLCLDCAAAEIKCKLQVAAVRHFCPFDPDGPVRAYQVQWAHAGFNKFAVAGPSVEHLCQTL